MTSGHAAIIVKCKPVVWRLRSTEDGAARPVEIALRAIRLPDAPGDTRKHRHMKKISEVRHYKVNPDGTLRFVGIEHVEVEEHHLGHINSLDLRDKADARRLAREQEEFERLVDAAAEA